MWDYKFINLDTTQEDSESLRIRHRNEGWAYPLFMTVLGIRMLVLRRWVTPIGRWQDDKLIIQFCY